MDGSTIFTIVIGIIALTLIWRGIKIVPQQQAWVVENLGRFHKTLEPGLNLLIPYVQSVAYKHSLKEEAIDIQQQTAITRDNVTLNIDGVLYVRVIDPKSASYGVSNPYYAITQLAQTNMRSEIGKLTLDQTFEERELLNTNIVQSINEAATSWGIQCMRYEIKDIEPPASVLNAMELQVAAERKKRAQILESEGIRDAQINVAEGEKKQIILESEGALTDQVNRAKGEAEAILAVAEATAEGIKKVAVSLKQAGGTEAASLKIAEQYVDAFKNLAKETNTVLLPANTNDAGSMVAQALTIFNSLTGKKTAEKMVTSSKNKSDEKNSPWE